MHRRVHLAFLLSIGLLASAALACGGGDSACTTSSDCSGGSTCIDGMCVARVDGGGEGIDAASCPAGTVGCADECVDITSSPTSCGTCGRACGAAQVCVTGECTGECSTGETRCGLDCADLATSTTHCTACRMTCESGAVCAPTGCCSPTDPPVEVCDGVDNDCDGTTDFAECDVTLVAWYRFEETDGLVLDSSGNGNHGTAMGGVTRGAAGRVGNAIALDGGGSTFVEVADSGTLRFGVTYTAEAWISATDCAHGASGHNTVASIEGEFLLAFQNTCVVANYVNNGAMWMGDVPTDVVPTSRFAHYAATWDGATVRSYIDGNPLGMGTPFTGGMPDTGRRMAIGARPDCCEQTYSGSVDELRFYAAVRTHEQICADAGGLMTDGVCAID